MTQGLKDREKRFNTKLELRVRLDGLRCDGGGVDIKAIADFDVS
jgi:hypothetical protein